MHRKDGFSWFSNIAVLVIVIAFFIISCLGYLMGDDIWMNGIVSNLFELVKHTGGFYLHSGGRLFSVACQYLFSGVLGDNRIWYAIVNTLFFVLFILICAKLIQEGKKGFASRLLLFALLFWFLCPVPKNTLFWIAGSTTYLWANTFSFLFLLLFQKYKDEDFDRKEKLGLFVLSFLAASEYITCAAISGALVVYYAFHLKKLKGNAIPFVVGFIVGSIVLLFAPGSLRRAGFDTQCASLFAIGDLVHHPVWEIMKYKALWLFLAVWVWGWIKDKGLTKKWTKDNAVLLLSLGWSVIAFSVVFRPVNRALFFTEALSMVLFMKFLYDYFSMKKNQLADQSRHRVLIIVGNVMTALLFVGFVVDAVFATKEFYKQRKNNEVSLKQIVDAGGVVALDNMLSSHRMAYAPVFYRNTFNNIAKKFDLDTVCVYPYYCMDKYYHQGFPIENVFVAYDYYADDVDVPNNVVVLVVRIEDDSIQGKNHVVFTVDCDKTIVLERNSPSYCYEGYGYYPFYFNRADAENLKSVRYEFN